MLRRTLFTAGRTGVRFATRSLQSNLPKLSGTAPRSFLTGSNLFKAGLAAGTVFLGKSVMEKELIEEKALLDEAQKLDAKDEFQARRLQFLFPKDAAGNPLVYLNGNSLGLPPYHAAESVAAEMKDWAEKGVRGHFDKGKPWLTYAELVSPGLARLVGAKPTEVVAMGSLTSNLNAALVSFYRPTKERYKVIRLGEAFGSDRYAVDSQIQQRLTTIKEFSPDSKAFDAKDAVVEIKPKPGQHTLTTQQIIDMINQHGDKTSVVLIEGVHYLSGQCFDLKAIAEAAHKKGCKMGVDLAHSVGNVFPTLHEDGIDFAVWCNYKYVNAGPGAIGGLFVHEKHHQDPTMPILAGWWGHNKSVRFNMASDYAAIPTAEKWQQSNPPIWQLASLQASLDIFENVDLKKLREKSIRLTNHMERLIRNMLPDDVEIITPSNPDERGSQLSLKVKAGAHASVEEWMHKKGIICDSRGEIIRVAPAALYNTHEDVTKFVIELRNFCLAHRLGEEHDHEREGEIFRMR